MVDGEDALFVMVDGVMVEVNELTRILGRAYSEPPLGEGDWVLSLAQHVGEDIA